MSNITWNNISEITDSSKKVIGQSINSLDDLNAIQNVFIAAVGHELGRLADQSDESVYTMAASATEALWGNLYQCDSESDTLSDTAQLVASFKNEAESAWLNLMWLLAVSKFSLEAGVYYAAQASENGNTNAIEHLASHKKNLATFEAIMSGVINTAMAD